jgi:F-type H+-transporting ATPase subunit b
VENAHKAIGVAEARATEYAEKLRQARSEIFKMREAREKQRNAEREAALDAARKAAGSKVGQARNEIDAEAETAKQAIHGSAGELANQVVRAVLPLAAGSSR